MTEMVYIQCNNVLCGETAEAVAWPHPGDDQSPERAVVDLPEGWGWDVVGVDQVIHCPDHRG